MIRVNSNLTLEDDSPAHCTSQACYTWWSYTYMSRSCNCPLQAFQKYCIVCQLYLKVDNKWWYKWKHILSAPFQTLIWRSCPSNRSPKLCLPLLISRSLYVHDLLVVVFHILAFIHSHISRRNSCKDITFLFHISISRSHSLPCWVERVHKTW